MASDIYAPMRHINPQANEIVRDELTKFVEKPMQNGVTILGESQQACVDLLAEALEQAQQGRVFSVGIIICLDGGFATVMAGHKAGDLNLGCDDLKLKILQAVTSGNVERPKPAAKPNILRVR